MQPFQLGLKVLNYVWISYAVFFPTCQTFYKKNLCSSIISVLRKALPNYLEQFDLRFHSGSIKVGKMSR